MFCSIIDFKQNTRHFCFGGWFLRQGNWAASLHYKGQCLTSNNIYKLVSVPVHCLVINKEAIVDQYASVSIKYLQNCLNTLYSMLSLLNDIQILFQSVFVFLSDNGISLWEPLMKFKLNIMFCLFNFFCNWSILKEKTVTWVYHKEM